MTQHTAQQIAKLVDGTLDGDANLIATGAQGLADAEQGDVAFLRNASDTEALRGTKASIVFVQEDAALSPREGLALIKVQDPDLACIQAAKLFAPPPPEVTAGVDPKASVDPSASLGEGVRIGPGAVVGKNAKIGAGTVLHAGAVVMDEAAIGEDCLLWPHAVVRDRCVLGDRCELHPGAVIGADGFGYRPNPTDALNPVAKVPQIGNVVLGDGVEIGANSCIDRATFGSTTLGDHVKVDNLVQIGHNTQVGMATVICGQCAIAGSCTIGMLCVIGGSVSMADQTVVGDQVKIAGGSGAYGKIKDGATVGGTPAVPMNEYRRQVAGVQKLPELMKWWKKNK